MLLSGQVTVRAAASPTPAPPTEIDTVTLRDLAVDHEWRRPVLAGTHLLILVTSGQGAVEVDFRHLSCRPGTLLRVRPGQALQSSSRAALDGMVVRWTGDAVAGLGRSAAAGPAHWQLTGAERDAVSTGIGQLDVDRQRHGEDEVGRQLLRHQLAVLLLRLALLTGAGLPAPVGEERTYQRFCVEVERTYQQTRRVEDYAARLRCSVRTLTRACLAATGRSAKQVIDERVALQACRLLAATDEPVAQLGRRLGFPEPTNFGRFFTREIGLTPGAFRTATGQGLGGRIVTAKLPAAPDG